MRVLFSTTPLDGHFRPMLPLARALQAAGHELAFATEASWHPHVVAEGFDALAGLYLDLCPPSFAWEQPRGESVRLRPTPVTAEAAPDWLTTLERPVVYVTLGTVFNSSELFRVLVDGLDGSVSALVTTGRNVDPGRSAVCR